MGGKRDRYKQSEKERGKEEERENVIAIRFRSKLLQTVKRKTTAWFVCFDMFFKYFLENKTVFVLACISNLKEMFEEHTKT